MQIGEATTAAVLAKAKWNHTGIHFVRGEEYEITAEGQWFDAWVRHGPDGDPSPSFYMRLWERFRRVPGENWFALIGALNEDPLTLIPIHSQHVVLAQADGELTCFANDVSFMYWNNSGEVHMTVRRIK